ncbi:MAG: polyprenyl diphosphate synthase [Natrialbaceae archaeon]
MAGRLRAPVEDLYARVVESELTEVPSHVAVIQDGNRRYAERRGVEKTAGHREGAQTTEDLLRWCDQLGIEEVTLYAFSTENFERPADEREAIFDLVTEKLREFADADDVHEKEVRIRAIGELDRLPERVREAIRYADERTAEYDNLHLNIALAYGGRAELLGAAREIARLVRDGELTAEEVDTDTVESAISNGPTRSVDLIVNFVNQLLPSRLTGRLAAPFVLRSKLGISYADATAVSGVHTALYALLYGLVATVGLAFAVGRLSIGLAGVLALSIGLYLLAGAAVLAAGTNLERLDWVFGGMTHLLGYLPRVGDSLAARAESAVTFTADATEAFRTVALDPGVWVRYAAGWTVAMVLVPGARVILLFAGFGVALEPAALVPIYLVMAYSVTLLPLTPGGFGVTEATTTAVFVALGVPSAAIVPIVFVDRFLGVYLPALAGWYPSLGIDRASLRTGDAE